MIDPCKEAVTSDSFTPEINQYSETDDEFSKLGALRKWDRRSCAQDKPGTDKEAWQHPSTRLCCGMGVHSICPVVVGSGAVSSH